MANRTNGGVGPGRRPATTREELEATAFALFAERGFDTTTVDDIAAAAGIGRRTFFRYFASKNDLVWGDFATELELIRALLDGAGPDVPPLAAVARAVVGVNRDRATHPVFRQRMELITTVPTLQAYATLRFADWRQVIATYVAFRAGVDPEDLLPQALAHAVLGAALAAVLRWLADGGDLAAPLEEALTALAGGFADLGTPTARRA